LGVKVSLWRSYVAVEVLGQLLLEWLLVEDHLRFSLLVIEVLALCAQEVLFSSVALMLLVLLGWFYSPSEALVR
jgi:hypothetical protein